MARIRTIKPEFPHSESMGRVSRDARLTFIQLWTLADDEGRLRGNSRMLASLLFPYDDDAKDLIDEWLTELEREKCIVRYTVEGTSYVQILNWLNHQKIDKPSKSKLPALGESSRILANPREESSGDQGSRIKDLKSGCAASPVDPRKQIFDLGKSILGADSGSLISKAIKQSDEATVFALLGEMAAKPKADPRAYFMAATKPKERRVVV